MNRCQSDGVFSDSVFSQGVLSDGVFLNLYWGYEFRHAHTIDN